MNQSTARMQYIAAVVIYGTVGVFLRYIDVPSEAAAFYRASGGCVSILVFMLSRGMKPDGAAIRANLKWLLASGASLGLNWIFLFAAYANTTVAIASLCNYTAPLMVLAVSPAIFGEKLGAKRLACIAAAVVGVVLVSGVVGAPQGATFNPEGIAMGMIAAVFFAIIVICNKMLKDINSFDRTVVQLGMAALTVLPYVVFVNGGVPVPGDVRSILLMLLVMVVHTGLAYIFYFGGMGALPVQEVALLGYLEPVVAVLGSALFLHEPLSMTGAIGAALVLGAAAAGELVSD